MNTRDRFRKILRMRTEEGRVSARAPFDHDRISSTPWKPNPPRGAIEQQPQPMQSRIHPPSQQVKSSTNFQHSIQCQHRYPNGALEMPKFIKEVDQAYRAVKKWRKNVFKVPSGSSGKHFVQTLTNLNASYGEKRSFCLVFGLVQILNRVESGRRWALLIRWKVT